VVSLLLTGFAMPAFGDDLAKAEKEFQEYGDAMVGVWTSTDKDGNVKEHEYRWIANETFIQVDVKKDAFKGTAIVGVDRESGKITTWWFAVFPFGTANAKVVHTKVGDQEWSTKMEGFVADGKKWTGSGTSMIDPEKGVFTGEGKNRIEGEEEKVTSGTWTRKEKT
jgi:hypothetical protein